MGRRILLAFIVLVLVGLGLWALLRNKAASPTPSTLVEAQNHTPDSPPSQAAPSISRAPSPATPAPTHPRSHTTNTVEGVPISQDVVDYVRKSTADPQYDWKQPINFYGKVVDDNSAPLSGATIDFKWNDLSMEGTSASQTVSDAEGYFSLLDRTGKRLYVQVHKDGYYTSRQSGIAFEYANPADGLFTPDSNNPVVFHLRKKGAGVDLVTSQSGVKSYFGVTLRWMEPLSESTCLGAKTEAERGN